MTRTRCAGSDVPVLSRSSTSAPRSYQRRALASSCSLSASGSRSRGSRPRRAVTTEGEPPSIARTSGVVPSGRLRSGSAPPSTRASATAAS
ncbi:hypothetical protein ACFTZ8_21995 [Streptomyces fungicidicus]|uniref:hypothetical protein n=1 Tax=Streptomyces fungicidicus TaxID=68203 RepID=UPI00363AA08D